MLKFLKINFSILKIISENNYHYYLIFIYFYILIEINMDDSHLI